MNQTTTGESSERMKSIRKREMKSCRPFMMFFLSSIDILPIRYLWYVVRGKRGPLQIDNQ